MLLSNEVHRSNEIRNNGEHIENIGPVDLTKNSEEPGSTAYEGHKNGGYQLPTKVYQVEFPKFDCTRVRYWEYKWKQFFDVENTRGFHG